MLEEAAQGSWHGLPELSGSLWVCPGWSHLLGGRGPGRAEMPAVWLWWTLPPGPLPGRVWAEGEMGRVKEGRKLGAGRGIWETEE